VTPATGASDEGASSARPVLHGITVIDLCTGQAGSVLSLLLAELGADVIKVEPPGGHRLRHAQPAAFSTWNRSKRSVVLDLDGDSGLRTLRTLLGRADVLVHELPPSKAAAAGLAAGELAAAFPRLIVSAITGYAAYHPDAERDGHDLLVQARMGLSDLQPGWREGPLMLRLPAATWAATYLAATAVAARLYEREITGRGGRADTSLQQGAAYTANLYWNRAERPSASLLTGPTKNVQFGTYRCGDDNWIAILNPGERVNLAALPAIHELLVELGLTDAPFRPPVLATVLRRRPADVWLDVLRGADVAVEQLGTLGGLLLHPEAVANGYRVQVDDPVWGSTLQAAVPVRTAPVARPRSPAPRLGADQGLLEEPRPVHGTAVASAAASHGAPGHGLPLSGVRVLDFGSFLAGPMATMLLADLGADVIKVEPLRGERMRNWRDDFIVSANRGKRGLSVDLRNPAGRLLVTKLIATADVVHHNMRPSSARELGIDEPSVRAIRPNLVFSHASAYGPDGERADWPGYDSVFQGMSGWTRELAGDGNEPVASAVGTLDEQTAALSAFATVLALYHRRRTGISTATEVSLLSTAIFSASETLLHGPEGGTAPYPKLTQDQTGLGPFHRLYECCDGWIALVADDEAQQDAVLAALGADGTAELADRARALPASEVLTRLTERDVSCERVREFYWFDFFDDLDHRAAGITVAYPHAEFGQLEQAGGFLSLDGTSAVRPRRAPPAVGEHTGEILAELGYSPRDIRSLIDGNTVRTFVPAAAEAT
jgi:crotonobetainyl-CoA:carnitine CoA-transferase CaiB-like acyl-CoA transferase